MIAYVSVRLFMLNYIVVLSYLSICFKHADHESHCVFYSCLLFSLQSPVDGKPMLLTPEESIQIQVSSSYPYLGFVVGLGTSWFWWHF